MVLPQPANIVARLTHGGGAPRQRRQNNSGAKAAAIAVQAYSTWSKICCGPKRAVRIAHRLNAKITSRSRSRLVLLLVPPAYPFLPFLWVAFGAWVMALEYMDYPLSNWNLTIRRQRVLLRKRRMLALGFGSGVTLLTTIPVLNFVAMPAAVIGGTFLWMEQLKKEILVERGGDESD